MPDLTPRQNSMFDVRNKSPEAQGFREGVRVEAEFRRDAIPEHLREFWETVEVICQRKNASVEDVVQSIYFIFHTPTRWERIKRKLQR